MTRNRLILLLTVVLAVGSFLVDVYFFPELSLPIAPYIIPVLVAAYLLPPRMVAGVAVLTILLRMLTDWGDGLAPGLLALNAINVGLGGILSTSLSAKISEEASLAERAENGLAQLRAVIDSMDEGLIISDLQGVILSANRVALRLLGLRGPEEIVQREWRETTRTLEFSHLDGRPVPTGRCPLDRILGGEAISGLELRVRCLDTGDSWIGSFSGRPVADRARHIILAVLTMRDITAQKEAEQFRQEYVALISHDLRSPLTSLMGYAQLLQAGLTKKGLEQEARSAKAIVESARRMNAMIQDLVDSARLESGRLELRKEPVEVCHLLTDISQRVGTVQDRHRVQVECAGHPFIVPADRERIERAIVNLITNALKYSPQDTIVTVRAERDNGQANLSVTDHGPGIPPEEQRHLFERFYQARAGKEKGGGLGLGLYITRLIVEAHGGRVWVRSAVGKGSTFGITLPIGEHASVPSGRPQQLASQTG